MSTNVDMVLIRVSSAGVVFPEWRKGEAGCAKMAKEKWLEMHGAPTC